MASPSEVRAWVKRLWDGDRGVRMRAAAALEKHSRDHAESLERYKPALIELMAETEQIGVRWQLAVLVPRLQLTTSERQQVVQTLRDYLQDRSSIVKTCAMQGLHDLSNGDGSMRPMVLELLRSLSRSGTPAMRARGRKLLSGIERNNPPRKRSV